MHPAERSFSTVAGDPGKSLKLRPWPIFPRQVGGFPHHPAISIQKNRSSEEALPAVAPQLERGSRIGLDVHRRLLGFQIKLGSAADAEAIIGRLGLRADPQ